MEEAAVGVTQLHEDRFLKICWHKNSHVNRSFEGGLRLPVGFLYGWDVRKRAASLIPRPYQAAKQLTNRRRRIRRTRAGFPTEATTTCD